MTTGCDPQQPLDRRCSIVVLFAGEALDKDSPGALDLVPTKRPSARVYAAAGGQGIVPYGKDHA